MIEAHISAFCPRNDWSSNLSFLSQKWLKLIFQLFVPEMDIIMG